MVYWDEGYSILVIWEFNSGSVRVITFQNFFYNFKWKWNDLSKEKLKKRERESERKEEEEEEGKVSEEYEGIGESSFHPIADQ